MSTAPRLQFHAWAATIRAAVAKMQTLAEESREKRQALERLLRDRRSDPAAINTLVVAIRMRRAEIERLIGALPALDELGQAGDAGGRHARSRTTKPRAAYPDRSTGRVAPVPAAVH